MPAASPWPSSKGNGFFTTYYASCWQPAPRPLGDVLIKLLLSLINFSVVQVMGLDCIMGDTLNYSKSNKLDFFSNVPTGSTFPKHNSHLSAAEYAPRAQFGRVVCDFVTCIHPLSTRKRYLTLMSRGRDLLAELVSGRGRSAGAPRRRPSDVRPPDPYWMLCVSVSDDGPLSAQREKFLVDETKELHVTKSPTCGDVGNFERETGSPKAERSMSVRSQFMTSIVTADRLHVGRSLFNVSRKRIH
ncbi:hypothetical protein EVAR_12830_1 [Eumeta japonica]|uniref:Uncharacterized protein n=1 Tax=Eumeta variegata TaxID=151549 RepID=A0A4C1UBP7_EUMVA|nr:hypothetical protein EVAR_12830_1 [Eumeta japonica]